MAEQRGNNSQNLKEILEQTVLQQGADGVAGGCLEVRSGFPASTNGPVRDSLAPSGDSIPTQESGSTLPLKTRDDRIRQVRERQLQERQQKLEELKEQAAAAHRFREQQEEARRQRLEEMRLKDSERRVQVEERKRLIQHAEQERRDAVLRKNEERDQRLELKRRQEKSNAVFAFGSSTPRMLDPRENLSSYWGHRRSTSSRNINEVDSSSNVRRSSESRDPDPSGRSEWQDLSRKRATSAHSLNRKTDDTRMSTSMAAVFNWDDGVQPSVPSRESLKPLSFPKSHIPSGHNESHFSLWEFGDNFVALGPKTPKSHLSFLSHPATAPPTPTATPHFSRRTASSLFNGDGSRHEEDLMVQCLPLGPSSVARRRTDLVPALPSLRDTYLSRGTPRHQSPGRALSLGRLEQLAQPRQRRPTSLAPLHEIPHPRPKRMTPVGTMSKSMSHLGPATVGDGVPAVAGGLNKLSSRSSSSLAHSQPRMTKAQILRQNFGRRAITSGYYGTRSGNVTPTSSSRPSSALSSQDTGRVVRRSQVLRKPRPFSIAGTTLSSVDAPSAAATPTRDSRPIERKNSGSSASRKVERAKSAGSDRGGLGAPARTTQRRTVAQVKAESAARKAKDLKSPLKIKSPPKSPPSALAGADEGGGATLEEPKESLTKDEKDITAPGHKEESSVPPKGDSGEGEESPNEASSEQPDEKPLTGYASELEYKAALAKNREMARDAKSRELALQLQRQREEEERERREEEEYLKVMEEQKRAEEERLERAIREAEELRLEEELKRDSEQRQREEAERLEELKMREAEEKAKKEEDERKLRKSRVAAIMSRTRGGKGTSTPSKNEAMTPSDESPNMNDALLASSMTDSFISNITSSMTDSMIAEVIESRRDARQPEGVADEALLVENGNASDARLGSFAGMNGINRSCDESANSFAFFDPLAPETPQGALTLRLSNEDAVNSNNPMAPLISLEDNLNKKQGQQSCESSPVPASWLVAKASPVVGHDEPRQGK